MQLESIQIAAPQSLEVGRRTVTTGIAKAPVATAAVTPEGVSGDHVVNTKHHGGPGQAVYLYSAEDYAWWQAELDEELSPGIFGENLTVSSFGTDDPRVGDRLVIGDVELELTSCRVPCDVFAARMNRPNWIRRFRDARRPGAYARVLGSGTVSAGDSIERLAAGEENVSILDTQDLYYGMIDETVAVLNRFLASPIAERNRVDYERRLAKLSA